jgi:Response regulator containing a CheY-like receiver domain and an HTH DNA-binding domain
MKVCGEADNIRDGFALIQAAKTQHRNRRYHLKGSSGLELLKDLRAQGVAVPALVLSMHDESLYAERALRAGARGYVNKGEDSAGLMRAIRQVLNGEIYLNTSFMSRMVHRMINGRDNGVPFRSIVWPTANLKSSIWLVAALRHAKLPRN